MEPTLYQWIHCRHGQPRLVADHLTLLRRAARALFGWEYRPDEAAVVAQLRQRVAAERLPDGCSTFVRVELSADRILRLTTVEVSLYDGYALRSLHPRTLTLPYAYPLDERWTTAAEAADRLTEEVARSRGADGAIRCNEAGHCLGWGAAQLFALRDGVMACGEEPQTAEAKLLAVVADRLGLQLRITPLTFDALKGYDELLAVDHRGITTFASCNGHPFIRLKAERLADAMERVVTVR